MGLIIVMIIYAAIIVVGEIWKKRSGIENIPQIFRYTVAISAIVLVIHLVILVVIPQDKNMLEKQDFCKEELIEVIELNEIESNIYINYSYSSKKYSYIRQERLNSDTIENVDKNIGLIIEVVSENEKARIEHYELSQPNNIWIYKLPWITLDKYVIYVPEKDMIGRTN